MSLIIIDKSAEFLENSLSTKPIIADLLLYFQLLNKVELAKLSDRAKVIFWINIYNSIVQFELTKMSSTHIDKNIFSRSVFNIAGEVLSLDQIEHGILRRNRWKWGFGYLPARYLKKSIIAWMPKEFDARIHYQLNCGAKSCPLIRVLNLDNAEYELVEGQRDFIRTETEISHDFQRIYISSLFLIYRGDFGGKKAIRQMVNMELDLPKYVLRFRKWNWHKQEKKIKK